MQNYCVMQQLPSIAGVPQRPRLGVGNPVKALHLTAEGARRHLGALAGPFLPRVSNGALRMCHLWSLESAFRRSQTSGLHSGSCTPFASIASAQGHAARVNCLHICRDRGTLYSGSQDGSLRVWQVR